MQTLSAWTKLLAIHLIRNGWKSWNSSVSCIRFIMMFNIQKWQFRSSILWNLYLASQLLTKVNSLNKKKITSWMKVSWKLERNHLFVHLFRFELAHNFNWVSPQRCQSLCVCNLVRSEYLNIMIKVYHSFLNEYVWKIFIHSINFIYLQWWLVQSHNATKLNNAFWIETFISFDIVGISKKRTM